MKNKNKGLTIVVVSLLAMVFLLPVYAQSQSGVMQQDRDQECTPEGPATRAYGEESPVQAREEKPEEPSEEETLEEEKDPIQEQTQTREQQRECNYENEDCEQCRHQDQHQYQYQYGQEEQD